MRSHRCFLRSWRRSPLVAACNRSPQQQGLEPNTYTLQGRSSIDASRHKKLVTIKHEEVKGFMPAMTMPYEVKDAKALDGLAPGDLINATLVGRIERRVSDGHQESRHGAAREGAGRRRPSRPRPRASSC